MTPIPPASGTRPGANAPGQKGMMDVTDHPSMTPADWPEVGQPVTVLEISSGRLLRGMVLREPDKDDDRQVSVLEWHDFQVGSSRGPDYWYFTPDGSFEGGGGNLRVIPTPSSPEADEARALVDRLTRPIIGIDNRTAQEAFDIMSDRIRSAFAKSERENGR